MDNMLFPMQQRLSAALCEVRECNAYSNRFGLILREDEIAELVQGREEALRGMDMNKNDAYLNLCEQPLTNAVGLSLIKKDVIKLHTDAAERKEITELLIDKNHGEREKLLRSSALGICGSLRITDRFVTEYVTSFALNLLPRLEAALEFGDVSNIFI